MTPEERAQKLFNNLPDCLVGGQIERIVEKAVVNRMAETIREAVAAAKAEEWEACAKICDPRDSHTALVKAVLSDRAAAIRARKETT